jgi:hypothetical protein
LPAVAIYNAFIPFSAKRNCGFTGSEANIPIVLPQAWSISVAATGTSSPQSSPLRFLMADMEPASFSWIGNPAFQTPRSTFCDARIGFLLLSRPKYMSGLKPLHAQNSLLQISFSITSPMSRSRIFFNL